MEFQKYDYKLVEKTENKLVYQTNFAELIIAKDEVSINSDREANMFTLPADLLLAIADKIKELGD